MTQLQLYKMANAILTENLFMVIPSLSIGSDWNKIKVFNAHPIKYDKIEFIPNENSNISDIILSNNDGMVWVSFIMSGYIDRNKCHNYKTKNIDILEVNFKDLKNELTYDLIKSTILMKEQYKTWIYNHNEKIAEDKILTICEPFMAKERGLAVHVDNCPLSCRNYRGKSYANFSDDCTYCEFNFWSQENLKGGCIGKAKIRFLQEFEAIKNIQWKDNQIVSLTKIIDGNEVTQKFEYHEPILTLKNGKTLQAIWDNANKAVVVAHQVDSKWYVLLESSPKNLIENDGKIYAKLGVNPNSLKANHSKQIWGAEDSIWEEYVEESKSIK